MSEIKIRLHPHARERMEERGVTEEEVDMTIWRGEKFAAKYGRAGFRRNFGYDGTWRGKAYRVKQVEVYAEEGDSEWLVMTVIARYF